MKPIIRVENLGKQYKIGEIRQPYSTLRETLSGAIRSPFKRFQKIQDDTFWALKDINFEVKAGEVVGIIGRNGAGKSTLLKILSRITEPTEGKVELYGRIASLLEVGTGFHPELSGRENIYLNGAILGMQRSEIQKKFDEIVAFAEIEKFIDTPVKHYSSGMYVRLAFAVAAHLEPEILIVDEVLAVGDVEFQKKCLGKMEEVSKGGRTVLFVSHQMGTIAQLCQHAILLQNGVVEIKDRANIVIDYYMNRHKSKVSSFLISDKTTERQDLYVYSAKVLDENYCEENVFAHNVKIRIEVLCKVNNWLRGAEIRLVLRDGRSMIVFTSDIELTQLKSNTKQFNAIFEIPENLLRPNNYSITLALFIPHQYNIEIRSDILFFTVYDNGTKYAQSEGVDYGLIFSPCKTYLVDIKD